MNGIFGKLAFNFSIPSVSGVSESANCTCNACTSAVDCWGAYGCSNNACSGDTCNSGACSSAYTCAGTACAGSMCSDSACKVSSDASCTIGGGDCTPASSTCGGAVCGGGASEANNI
jgi:hypothetical protein